MTGPIAAFLAVACLLALGLLGSIASMLALRISDAIAAAWRRCRRAFT